VSGSVLYVADINTIRLFDRASGAPVGEVVIAGAAFLNDVAAAGDGTIYVTDSATGLVHMVSPDGSFEQLAGVQLEGPNGIYVADNAILVAADEGLIVEVGAGGQVTPLRQAPAGGLDGLILLDDGTILVSSWQGSAVYLIDSVGQASELFGGVNAPADIGFDAERSLVLIPRFQNNMVEARPLP
jgi:DNA-binding beta-propeller fold protein YncE